ncbi:glycosyltransferase [bacterium]|nr:glycosyltransferase [bacterium]
MKILVLSHMYPQPGREHYGVFVHEGLLALRARGHEIEVIAPLPHTPPGLAWLSGEWRRLARIPARRSFEGITLRHPRYLLLPRRLGFAGASARMARAVEPLLEGLRGRFDLLHAHAGVPDGAAARRLAATLGLPYVVTSHGSDVLRAPRWAAAVHDTLHDAFADATAVIFPSSAALRRAGARGLPVDRGAVVANGFRRDLFLAAAPLPLREDPLQVICVANLVPSKNVDRLIEAMARVATSGLALRLHVVGDGPQAPALRHQAEAAGLAVAWSPALTREELAAALRAADIFALPATGESFGIVYLEAMAAGLPVIAPAGEGIADVIAPERDGLLLPDVEVDTLAAALRRLAADPELRGRIGEAARERAREMDWEAHAERLEAIYAGVLEGAARSAPRGRVLHLLYNSEPDHNGYAIRSRYILQGQRDLGWQVSATTGPFQGARWSEGSRESREGILYHRLRLPGTDRRRGRLGWRRFLVFAQKAVLDRLLAGRVAAILRDARPALLHAHSPAFNLNLARRAARRAGVPALPVVYEVRGLTEETESLVGNTRSGGWLYRKKRRVEERAMAAADAVVTLGEGMRADFVARGIPSDRLFLMPNGVDTQALQPVAPDPARARGLGLTPGHVLGFVGSMGRLEGLPWLVEQLAALPEPWRLLLIGDGQDRPRLLALARELGVEDRILAPGSVPHAEVADWYALLDFVVLPRLSLRVTELVTPLKPLEAMAAERVVLVSDIGGHRELVLPGVNGLLFSRDDAAAFRATLEALAADPARRQALAASARRWVEAERDWRRLLEGYAQVYAAAAARAAQR